MRNPRDELKRKIPLALVVCLLLLTVPVLAQVSSSYDLSWHVIAGGGGESASAGHTLLGTVGQPLAGATFSSGHTLYSGFWCSGAVQYRIYLPLVLRNSQ